MILPNPPAGLEGGVTQEEATAIRNAVSRLRGDYDTFARNFATIVNKDGQVQKLTLNYVQEQLGKVEREMLAEVDRARIYVLKARRAGVSTDQQARMLHLIWSVPHCYGMTLSATGDDVDKLFGMTRRMVENFPRQVTIPEVPDKTIDFLHHLGDARTREVSFPEMDSYFWTGTAGAKRTGRGLEFLRLHCSEYTHWEDPETSLTALTPAMRPNGSTIVLETTAGAYGGAAHQHWLRAQKGEDAYRAVFFPWWEADPIKYRIPLIEPDELGALEQDELNLVNAHGLTLEQIKWRRHEMLGFPNRSMFLQEYAEDADTCWLAAGTPYYDSEMLRLLRGKAPSPYRSEEMYGGRLEFYLDPDEVLSPKNPDRDTAIVIGCDVAEGGGGDRSTWTARAWPSWRLVAVFQSSHIPPEELADMIFEYGKKWKYAFLVVEKNGLGVTVNNRVKKKGYKLSRIYHRVPIGKVYERRSHYMGWTTTAESYPLMLSAAYNLFRAAQEGLAGVPSASCLSDAVSVGYDKETGKIELTGRDVLVSEMLAWLGREQVARGGGKKSQTGRRAVTWST